MNTPSYLPSKQFLIGLLGLVAVGGIVGGIYWYAQKDDVSEANPSLAIQETRQSTRDSDEDGLKDWEEALWDTSKESVDTDEDGTSDGEEVAANRDPRIAGPNDALTEFQKDTLYDVPSRASLTNNTENLFNASLPQALVLANASINGDEVTEEDIDQFIAPYTSVLTITPNTYSQGSLSIITNPSNEDIGTYAQNLSKLIDQYKDTLGQELAVIGEGVQTNDPNLLLSLRSTALRYETFSRELVETAVPAEYSGAHLRVANSYATLSGALTYISALTIDPLQGLKALKEYRTASNEADAALGELLFSISRLGFSVE